MEVQHDIRDQQCDHWHAEFVLPREVSTRAQRNRGEGREVQPAYRIRMLSEEPGGDAKYYRRDNK